jgi:hypothetical protein
MGALRAAARVTVIASRQKHSLAHLVGRLTRRMKRRSNLPSIASGRTAYTSETSATTSNIAT